MELYDLTIYKETNTIRLFIIEPEHEIHYKAEMESINTIIKKVLINIQNGRILEIEENPVGIRYATSFRSNLKTEKNFFETGSARTVVKTIFEIEYK